LQFIEKIGFSSEVIDEWVGFTIAVPALKMQVLCCY